MYPFALKRHNFFTEVETSAPGRKPVAQNYSLLVGLSQKTLGNDGMGKILLYTNTPAPFCKSLQKKTSNKVLAQIKTLNIVDMSRICHQLVDVNTTREQESPQCDGMYNSPLSSGVGVRQKLSTLDLFLS